MTGYRQIYSERVLIFTTEKYVKLNCRTPQLSYFIQVFELSFILSRVFGENNLEAPTNAAHYGGKHMEDVTDVTHAWLENVSTHKSRDVTEYRTALLFTYPSRK